MIEEIEIKIKVDSKKKQEIKERLGEFTATVKETTYGFFTKNEESIEKGIFPRIKKYGNGTGLLTVKIRKKDNKNYFQRDEYEKKIKDIEWYRNFLKILGYEKEIIFEKERETRQLKNGVILCLDRLPFGDFIEIEGEEDLIEKTVKELGLERQERITVAYLVLWESYRNDNGIKEKNCIF